VADPGIRAGKGFAAKTLLKISYTSSCKPRIKFGYQLSIFIGPASTQYADAIGYALDLIKQNLGKTSLASLHSPGWNIFPSVL
jgi:hypothetical protein